jgi:hypothetical protein
MGLVEKGKILPLMNIIPYLYFHYFSSDITPNTTIFMGKEGRKA